MSDVFVTGTMKPDAPSYIERAADRELFDAVLAGQYCSVLTTRQMGKSSLMARTARQLRDRKIACATVDLQGRGTDDPPPEQFYYGVTKQIIDTLPLDFDLSAWWKKQDLLLPSQCFTDFLGEVVLARVDGPVIVFVDEVDWMIRLSFSDEFFAAIRSCFNRRATDSRFDRLSFVLLGAATPAQLIRDPSRTPFNIGRGIELTDFTRQEAKPLAALLGENGDAVLDKVFLWTDGHPYLTQRICAEISSKDGQSSEVFVDTAVQKMLLSPQARQRESNLKFVGDRLQQGGASLKRVLRVYRQVLRGKAVPDQSASPIHTSLRMSGIVKLDAEQRLKVRNRIYRAVFDEKWVRDETPADWVKRTVAASAAVVVASSALWYFGAGASRHFEALETASADTEVAYRAYDATKYRPGSDEAFAQFWERRDDRDVAILVRAINGGGKSLTDLVGSDYGALLWTARFGGRVNAVAFSPDGKRVATASGDSTARVFDASTGNEISRFSHEGPVFEVAFSPDGKRVATHSIDPMVITGSGDSTVRVFDASTGSEISRFSHKGVLIVFAFSPDWERIATVFGDGTVYVFDASTGTEISRLSDGPDFVAALAFSPDGKRVVTNSGDNRQNGARVFEAATGRVISRLSNQGPVHAVAFSPDGKRVATGSNDSTARVFDASTGSEISRLSQSKHGNCGGIQPRWEAGRHRVP
jgi:hypothetical protein